MPGFCDKAFSFWTIEFLVNISNSASRGGTGGTSSGTQSFLLIQNQAFCSYASRGGSGGMLREVATIRYSSAASVGLLWLVQSNSFSGFCLDGSNMYICVNLLES